jgi:flagellar biosynthesis protein FlhF
MKITRHTAKDMRQALRLVREQLGPDAVIMTSKRIKGGVEVTAAIDFDAEQFEAQTAAPSEVRPFRPEELTPPSRDVPRPEHDPYTSADTHQSAYARVRAAVEAEAAAEAASSAELEAEIESSMAATDASGATSPSPAIAHAPTQATAELGTELKNLRRILETQLAQLAWNDLTRRAPIHTEILRELTEIGLAQDFAAQVVAQLPAGADVTMARRLSIAFLAQRLAVTGDRWLDKGGRIALIGPTGVGKTTALAKLAVRWVLRHGPRGLALISADSVRIGAHDQIQALGQMLDVPVYTADSFAEIPQLLESLAQKRFVLIDTPGSSQRDAQLSARMAQLAAAGSNMETALVLSASTQAGAIEETVTRFATANASSCLLTKVDEAASLGGVLSVLTRAQLPISYVSEGQRVPEDLRPARALELVSSAVQLAKTSGAAADEDLLRRRYGEVAHALA